MGLLQYRDLDFYSNLYSSSSRLISGQNTQLWISKDGRRTDTHFKIEPFSESATKITIKAIAKTGKFYKGDVLTIFSEGEKESEQILLGHLILDETLSFVQDQISEVSIYPASFESLLQANAYCACLTPVLSIKNGGMLAINSLIAEAENKSQLFPVKKIVSRTGVIDFDGFAIMDSDALALLKSLTKGWENLYYEIRYHPVIESPKKDFTFGTGPCAYRGESAVSFSLNSFPQDDFVKATCKMDVGTISDYSLDYEFFFTRFCPINLETFYGINYTLDVQSGIVDGYCPIDLTPFYEVF